ncbi:hypothetical protein B5F74_05185 [Collinsella sp. An271]|uniref:hypothetical protein n=1 Tax=Collinsella sp. An271 TaxID=1965616 RepID=UPI000B3A0A85|nr:hypothetical protein [Collinsella sp. An271]OUO61521.1 hypothetical protein B5F74_05185 [Collinsella sp. An271]
MDRRDEQTGLGCMFGVLMVVLAVMVSIAVGIFFGAGFGFLAFAAWTVAAIAAVAVEYKKTVG